MKGYHKNEAATNEAIDKDGFLHSGDLGVKDENGNHRITGSYQGHDYPRGENIYPRELEEFLYHFPRRERRASSCCSFQEIWRGSGCLYHPSTMV